VKNIQVKLRVLKRSEINIKKWDECITNSINCRHQALTWHLDIVSPHWQGVVYEDYKAVMPLPTTRKFGIPMILQPFLTQQLGVFSSDELIIELLNGFYKTIKKKYPVVYNVNITTNSTLPTWLHVDYLSNVELNLNREYLVLKREFSKNTKRNISKAKKEAVVIEEIYPRNSVFDFIFSNQRYLYSTKEQTLFKEVVKQSFVRNEGVLVACFDQKHELLAVSYFIIYKNRITFVTSASSTSGYAKQAAFLIFDRVIEKYSSKKNILDFDGSQTAGVARFYKGFGGIVIEYAQVKNRAFVILMLFRKVKDFFS